MIRRTIALPALLALALWPSFVPAQEQFTSVYFEPLKGEEFVRLNKAVQAALSEPPLQLAEKPGARVLIVSVPGKVEVSRKQISGTAYSFVVAFSRDGNALGQSQQDCNADMLSDCANQIVLDARSLSGPH